VERPHISLQFEFLRRVLACDYSCGGSTIVVLCTAWSANDFGTDLNDTAAGDTKLLGSA
jgi:hypothetical protein